MPARYRITHTSRYDYDRSVVASFNEARLTPMQTPWQVRLESSLQIEPPAWQHRFTDYWGTEVRAFEAGGPHRSLTVRATSTVEVDARRRSTPPPITWAQLRAAEVTDTYVEYLTQTPLTYPPNELAALAEATAAANEPTQTVDAVNDLVHGALTYVPGSTEVHTVAREAWSARSGVCQDYAHIVVGALRHVGIPARYVSGYLHPAADPELGETALGESHAWIEAWLGEWVAFDPTNGSPVAERHVMIGAGRDYGDVPPIKGIVAGTHTADGLAVTVELTRLA